MGSVVVGDVHDTGEAQATRSGRTPWHAYYWLAIYVTDVALIAAALVIAQFVRFGAYDDVTMVGDLVIPYAAVGAVVAIFWVFSLSASGSREKRVAGAGMEEYRAVLRGTAGAFGAIAILSYLFQVDISRGYFVTALPAGLVLLLAGRLFWRLHLARVRVSGRALTGAIVVGQSDEVTVTISELLRHPEAGYTPVAVAIADGSHVAGRQPPMDQLPRVPVRKLREAATSRLAGAVIVAGGMKRGEIRQLGWDLENTKAELVLMSRLTDVAGPRIHLSPVQGVPMMHVDLPRYSGFNHIAKRCMDIMISLTALVVLLPLFALIALAIKLEDHGPVIFRQQRIGRGGTTFTMHKFRSMAVDAEARLAALRERSEGNDVMFKLKDDPRVTRVGRVLRRFSLDELPQFRDVLAGHMSVVGPRPPLPVEVEAYEATARRRLITRPGITGLWQVSGRSDLSWEETVRLDLRYVENWSISGDIVIILKTIRAMLRPSGAY